MIKDRFEPSLEKDSVFSNDITTPSIPVSIHSDLS
jgi:hypothetical protein